MRNPLLLLLLLGLATPAQAQLPAAPDSAQFQRAREAGTYLVHWIEKTDNSEQTIHFRNISQIPIRVENWEVYNCINLGGRSCGVHADSLLLQPGQSVRIATVRQRDSRAPWSYQYRFRVSWFEAAPAPPAPAAAAPPR